MTTNIGIAGFGTYFPSTIETAADLVERTGVPENILREKMGIRQRHIAGEADTVTLMATEAARTAIVQAGIDPNAINLVISHGSEYKDHIVWNSAAKIQQNVGALNAYAFEMYALCAGAPIAMNAARGMMIADENLRYVLLAAGSRENDLVDLSNQRARFMFNFGAGGGAMLLERGATKNLILGASAFTDGSLSETVVLTQQRRVDAEGSENNGDAGRQGRVGAGRGIAGTRQGQVGADDDSLGDLRGRLDVTDPKYMATRLGEVSLPNFRKVIVEAVERSAATLDDVKFLGITHMKRSFYVEILESVGLTPEQSVYLEDYGHVQSVDQVLALELGLAQGKIKPGDLIVLAGAGVGYTWSAVTVRWG